MQLYIPNRFEELVKVARHTKVTFKSARSHIIDTIIWKFLHPKDPDEEYKTSFDTRVDFWDEKNNSTIVHKLIGFGSNVSKCPSRIITNSEDVVFSLFWSTCAT